MIVVEAAIWTWPDWVPDKVRQDIEGFWKWHRGAEGYAAFCANDPKAGNAYNHQPPLGAWVLARDFGEDSGTCYGRWVPAWNNIGRVIQGDRVRYCSTPVLAVNPFDYTRSSSGGAAEAGEGGRA